MDNTEHRVERKRHGDYYDVGGTDSSARGLNGHRAPTDRNDEALPGDTGQAHGRVKALVRRTLMLWLTAIRLKTILRA